MDENTKKLLSREEEAELAKRMKSGDGNARKKLIEANTGLVRAIAIQYQNTGVDLDDLIDEGYIGLIDAVDRFDPLRGKLSTYATYWIRQKIEREIKHAHQIKIPDHKTKYIKQIKTFIEKYSDEHGIDPSDEEISKAVGIDYEDVSNIRNIIYYGFISKDAEIEDGNNSTIEDFISDGCDIESETVDVSLEIVERMIMVLETLTPAEKRIIELRLGIEGKSYKCSEIAKKTGKTEKEISLLEKKAEEKLKTVDAQKIFMEIIAMR